MDELVKIYCDGACKGNPGPGGWGVYVVHPDGQEEDLYGSGGHTTNNRMELIAMGRALSRAQDFIHAGLEVVIYSDSTYVAQGLTQWAKGWESKGWDKVKNKELWIPIWDLYKQSSGVTIRWVRGHNGNPGNEKADELANKGVYASV